MSASPEIAAVYAALILQDAGIEITADSLSSIVSAANIEVDSIWFTLFEKALAGKNLSDLLFSFSAASASTAGSAPVVSDTGAPTTAPAAAKKEEVKEESDEEMGFGLFD